MKRAVLNLAGTVGKTTIVGHMLAPRMPGAPVLAIESINSAADTLGVDVEKIRGDQFRRIFADLVTLDEAILDVGASNVEGFLAGLAQFQNAHLEIDQYIVPAIPESKVQGETIATVKMLTGLGVPPARIHVVFNRVKADPQDEFLQVWAFAAAERTCIANAAAAVLENEVFDLLGQRGLTLAAALNDPADYRAKLRELGRNGDPAVWQEYMDLHTIKALGASANANLDEVFACLNRENE